MRIRARLRAPARVHRRRLMVALTALVIAGATFRYHRRRARLVRRGRRDRPGLADLLRRGAGGAARRPYRRARPGQCACRRAARVAATCSPKRSSSCSSACWRSTAQGADGAARRAHGQPAVGCRPQLTQSVIPIGAVLFIIAELLRLPQVLRARPHGRLRRPRAARKRSSSARQPSRRRTAQSARHDHHPHAHRHVRAGADQRADRGRARRRRHRRRLCIVQGPDMLPNMALVMFDGASSFPLLAIPLFILAGAHHERVLDLAPADRLRLRAGRLHPRRAVDGGDRHLDVLRRDFRLGGGRRRRARHAPDPGHEARAAIPRNSPPPSPRPRPASPSSSRRRSR